MTSPTRTSPGPNSNHWLDKTVVEKTVGLDPGLDRSGACRDKPVVDPCLDKPVVDRDLSSTLHTKSPYNLLSARVAIRDARMHSALNRFKPKIVAIDAWMI